jgi:hypothetical protein
MNTYKNVFSVVIALTASSAFAVEVIRAHLKKVEMIS